MPRVVVVTAAKNASAFLENALASVRSQDFTDWEHVVVDDGSTDDTPQIVEDAAAADKRVRLIRLESSVGPYAAANVAMLDADCEFLARLDADDVALAGRLRLQVDAMEAQPAVGAHVGAFRTIDERGVETHRTYTFPTRRNGVIKWMLWLRGGPLHSTLLIRRDYFQALSGYGNDRVGEDYRLWCRVARDGKLGVTNRPLALYRSHSEQITARKGTFEDPVRVRARLEHFAQCDPDGDWTEADALDFRSIGSWDASRISAARAVSLLQRWDGAWRRDTALGADERRELAARSARTLVIHLARSVRANRPGAVKTSVRMTPRIAVALARMQRFGYASWYSD